MAKGKIVGKILANASIDGGRSAVSGAFEKVKRTGRQYVDAMAYDTQNVGARVKSGLEQDAKKISHEIGKAKRDGLSDQHISRMQQKHARVNATAKSLSGSENLAETMDSMSVTGEAFNGLSNRGIAKTSSQVAGAIAKDYFWDGANKNQRIARIGTAVGAYGAVNAAGRKLTGGTATYNSKGERDIAGVPFM